jgi:hypothetical protein
MVYDRVVGIFHTRQPQTPVAALSIRLPMGAVMIGIRHATRSPLAAPGFARRAAVAWIRAADAGLIDAGELTWLLAHLPPEPPRSVRAGADRGVSG